MVSVFATKKIRHPKINSANDEKLKEFDKKFHTVLLNLAKRIAADGEGSSKFVTVNVINSKTFIDAKNIAFSIANSPLVKTAIAGEDPNWGRIIMAIGKSNVELNLKKLAINFGNIKVIEKGQLIPEYQEIEVAEYMRGEKIDLTVDLNMGNKEFTAFTMDFTKKYIEINADYRS
jgi:glutamate N-acetyltransferase/amino-acid N-acetyltransferase